MLYKLKVLLISTSVENYVEACYYLTSFYFLIICCVPLPHLLQAATWGCYNVDLRLSKCVNDMLTVWVHVAGPDMYLIEARREVAEDSAWPWRVSQGPAGGRFPLSAHPHGRRRLSFVEPHNTWTEPPSPIINFAD